MSLIISAAALANRLHAGQLRKWTNRPYIEHPMRVAGRVSLVPGVEDYVVAAAWTHDVYEDCGVSLEYLHEMKLPMTTVDLVRELTNPSKQFPHLRRAERKAMDREHIAKVSKWAQVIKIIDRTDNLREMSVAPPDFKRLYATESLLLSLAFPMFDDLTGPLNTELLTEINKILQP